MLDFVDSAWRRHLFDQWDLLRMSVAVICPNTRWWLWGTLVTSRVTAFQGGLATVNAVAIIAASELPHDEGQRELLTRSIGFAEQQHRVDADLVFEFPVGDTRSLMTDEALAKWRRRASRNIVDDETRDQVDAGYIEVLP